VSQARDPGLQPERTALAWQRTSVGFVGAALLFLRWGSQHGPVVASVTALAALVGGWTFVSTRRRMRRVVASFPHSVLPSAATEVLVLTAATVALGVGALWIALAD
jgi:uncharacterized membrane protein YidH (DUF202 family)